MDPLDRLFRMADETAEEGVILLRDMIRFETVNTGVMPTKSAACPQPGQARLPCELCLG